VGTKPTGGRPRQKRQSLKKRWKQRGRSLDKEVVQVFSFNVFHHEVLTYPSRSLFVYDVLCMFRHGFSQKRLEVSLSHEANP